MEGQQIGKVTHYFPKAGVAVVELSHAAKIGDTIHIKGHTTDFKQKITSMQIEHDKVDAAQASQSIGLKVDEPVREHDLVYRA